ncbi:RagB/SusD family nutrient uptake outer membrane protein [Chryseolinea sp. H1M3-3]|uniref:RagB/SusD family nutrient uptake outer membrane protein n=1 Tax=Chryseolinea sp. H1M3-3 TaxID=3034144 RepID=UPI0023EBCBB4|nr:RagB/SusD family nutrient uptake outer membrane protein [Chryseolinea sp. H1M3-3]
MKYNIKRTLKSKVMWSVFVTLSLLYSCSDSFLEVPAPGSLNEELLSNGPGIEAALLAVYSQVNGRDNRMGSPSNWVWGSIRGGEANKGTDPGDFSDINPIQRYEALPSQGVIRDKYNANYEGVSRANRTLRLVSLAPGETNAQTAQKLSVEAQAKFLRAHFYFELARGFDKTPYVDENIDVAGAGVEPGIEKVPNDKSLWPMIEADMLFAYNNLPETQAQVGRVNKWAAASYLAKIYMYQGKYQAALDLFELIIPAAYGGTGSGKTSNGKTYGLVPLYADIFKASNDNNEESVWAYQAAANTGSVNNANPEFDLNWPYNTGADGPGNCCSFFQPTFEMGNSFRTSGGLPLLEDGTGAYDPAYNLPANELLTDMGKETADPFTPDAGPVDPRLDHSIGRRGIPYLDWQDFPGKAWIRNQPNAGPYQTKKYAYYKTDKGSLQDNTSWTPGYTAINYTIIRFADVLLMAAEAEYEVGSPERARELVNYVRARAANPAGFVMKGGNPAANYVINQYPGPWAKDATALEAIRFERKLELSGEGHRFYDLARWSGAYGAPTSTPDYIERVITGYLTYESPKLPSGAFAGASFEAKDRFLPLPQAEIDLVGPDILKQNTGF